MKKNNEVALLFLLQSKTWPAELPLRFSTFKSVASEEQREWCAPLSPKSHFYSIYIQKGGLCSLPGILQTAMHISFVLGRHWLISVCNDKEPSTSSNTDVQFILQRNSCFVFRIRMRKSSIQHCCTVTQRLFWQLYNAVGPNAFPYRSRRTEIRPVLARESQNKVEVVAKCSETTTYFHVAAWKPRVLSYPRRAAPGFNLTLNNQLNTFAHQRKGRNHVEQKSAWSWQKLWGVRYTW